MQNEGVPGEEGRRGSAKGEPRKGGGGVDGEGNLTEEDKKKRGKKTHFHE